MSGFDRHSRQGPPVFLVLLFHPMCTAESRRLVRSSRRGLMKQLAIRLSWQKTPAKSLVMSEHAVRVPQPPDQSSNAGYPAGAANRGGLFLGYFLLATQKKVTSCRATPGEVDFVCVGHASLCPTYILFTLRPSLSPQSVPILWQT